MAKTKVNTLPLTAIILTDRSDQVFENALKSVQFADDVLVIANKVADDVSKLRSQYTFQMIPWDKPITDFAAVRNFALSQAHHDWVLFLDSDEIVKKESVREIEELITNPTAVGYGVRRSDVFYGKQLEYGEAGNQLVLRLGLKEHMKFTGAVHEVADVAGKVEASTVQILHYSHTSISEFIRTIDTYTQLVVVKPGTSFWQVLFELVVYPPAKFVYSLVILGGVADGWHGVVYATCMSFHSLLVRIYRYEKLFVSRT